MEDLKALIVPAGRKTNICFDCAYPISKCPWLHKGEPVEGWTAKKQNYASARINIVRT